MPLTLEQETKLLPLLEKASELIVNLISEDNPDSPSEKEFQKTIRQISDISPFVYQIHLNIYNRIPDIKRRLLDYIKNNI
ncbi:MAG TPA: hypothetical protein VMC80_01480 [Patescibacteria group bacterium]|nr:hypothetical protein [Patescibacteria group bacterium]